jgi:dTDP-glucose 4,6-dehydratase
VTRLLRCLDEARPRGDGTPYEHLITFVEDRPGHDRLYSLATDKIHREVGWSPSIQLIEGLKRTVAWYLANLDWIESVTHGRYDLSRLGLL